MEDKFKNALNGLSTAERTQLTKANEAYFKLTFDYHLESEFSFSSINTVSHSNIKRPLSKSEKLGLLQSFAAFVDDSVQMTYNEVEQKYGRQKVDKDDIRSDGDGEYQVIHYQLSNKGLGRIARIHGYIRNGYFVVLRMDWCHNFHQKRKLA